MTGPLLFFAEYMLSILGLGLVLGLGLLVASIRSLRRLSSIHPSRWRRLLLGIGTVVAIGLIAASVFVLVQLGPTLATQSVMVGEPSPPLEFHNLESRRMSDLSEQQGQVVLVNFWATWCPPCREEMPTLDRLHKDLGDRGLVVLLVSDESVETIEKYLESEPMSVLHGQADPLPWPEFGRPTSFIVDRTGVVRQVIQGPRTYDQFLDIVSPWL